MDTDNEKKVRPRRDGQRPSSSHDLVPPLEEKFIYFMRPVQRDSDDEDKPVEVLPPIPKQWECVRQFEFDSGNSLEDDDSYHPLWTTVLNVNDVLELPHVTAFSQSIIQPASPNDVSVEDIGTLNVASNDYLFGTEEVVIDDSSAIVDYPTEEVADMPTCLEEDFSDDKPEPVLCSYRPVTARNLANICLTTQLLFDDLYNPRNSVKARAVMLTIRDGGCAIVRIEVGVFLGEVMSVLLPKLVICSELPLHLELCDVEVSGFHYPNSTSIAHNGHINQATDWLTAVLVGEDLQAIDRDPNEQWQMDFATGAHQMIVHVYVYGTGESRSREKRSKKSKKTRSTDDGVFKAPLPPSPPGRIKKRRPAVASGGGGDGGGNGNGDGDGDGGGYRYGGGDGGGRRHRTGECRRVKKRSN